MSPVGGEGEESASTWRGEGGIDQYLEGRGRNRQHLEERGRNRQAFGGKGEESAII